MYLRKHNLDLGGDASTCVPEQAAPAPQSPPRSSAPLPGTSWSPPASGSVSAELRDLMPSGGTDTHEPTPQSSEGFHGEETPLSAQQSAAPGQREGRGSLTDGRGSYTGRGSLPDGRGSPFAQQQRGSIPQMDRPAREKSGSYPENIRTPSQHTRNSLPARLTTSSPAARAANGAATDPRAAFDAEPIERGSQTHSAVPEQRASTPRYVEPEPRVTAPVPVDRSDGPYEEMMSSRLDSDPDRPPVAQTPTRVRLPSVNGVLLTTCM